MFKTIITTANNTVMYQEETYYVLETSDSHLFLEDIGWVSKRECQGYRDILEY